MALMGIRITNAPVLADLHDSSGVRTFILHGILLARSLAKRISISHEKTVSL